MKKRIKRIQRSIIILLAVLYMIVPQSVQADESLVQPPFDNTEELPIFCIHIYDENNKNLIDLQEYYNAVYVKDTNRTGKTYLITAANPVVEEYFERGCCIELYNFYYSYEVIDIYTEGYLTYFVVDDMGILQAFRPMEIAQSFEFTSICYTYCWVSPALMSMFDLDINEFTINENLITSNSGNILSSTKGICNDSFLNENWQIMGIGFDKRTILDLTMTQLVEEASIENTMNSGTGGSVDGEHEGDTDSQSENVGTHNEDGYSILIICIVVAVVITVVIIGILNSSKKSGNVSKVHAQIYEEKTQDVQSGDTIQSTQATVPIESTQDRPVTACTEEPVQDIPKTVPLDVVETENKDETALSKEDTYKENAETLNMQENTIPVSEEEQRGWDEISEDVVKGWHLRGLTGNFEGMVFPVYKLTAIGRNIHAEISYPPEAKGISRVHCEITESDGAIMLKDMQSTYGTFLGQGFRLEPWVQYQLQDGDTFYLADSDQSFRLEKEELK